MFKILTVLLGLVLPLPAAAGVVYDFRGTTSDYPGFSVRGMIEVTDAAFASGIVDSPDDVLTFSFVGWFEACCIGWRVDFPGFVVPAPLSLILSETVILGGQLVAENIVAGPPGYAYSEASVVMTGAGGLWTGTFRSDGPVKGITDQPDAPTSFTFSGVWDRRTAVAGPGPVALVLAGLGWLLRQRFVGRHTCSSS